MVYVFMLMLVFHSGGRENTGLNDAPSELLSLLGDETPFGLYDDARLALHMANEGIHLAKWKHTTSSPVNPIPSPCPYIPRVYGLCQDSSARVTGQNTPLYNPPLLAGVPPVQDDSEQVPVECDCVLVADIYLVHSISNVKPFDTLLFTPLLIPSFS